jgi:hypothetical protein
MTGEWSVPGTDDPWHPANGFVVIGEMVVPAASSILEPFAGTTSDPFGESYRDVVGVMANRCAFRIPSFERNSPMSVNPDAIDDEMAGARRTSVRAPLFEHFADAWLSFPIRVAVMRKHATELAGIFPETPGGASRVPATENHPERFAEHMFGLAVNAHSALEVFAYAAWTLAAVRRPNLFPLGTTSDVRRIGIDECRKRLESPDGFPRERLTRRLRLLMASEPYRRLKLVRHVLIHRGAPVAGLMKLGDTPVMWVNTKTHFGEGSMVGVDDGLVIAASVTAGLVDLVADAAAFIKG